MHTKVLVFDWEPVIQKKNKTFLLINKTLHGSFFFVSLLVAAVTLFLALVAELLLENEYISWCVSFVHCPRALATLLSAGVPLLHQVVLFAFAYVANCFLFMGKIIVLCLLVEIGSRPF